MFDLIISQKMNPPDTKDLWDVAAVREIDFIVDTIRARDEEFADKLEILTKSEQWQLMTKDSQMAYRIVLQRALREGNLEEVENDLFLKDHKPFLNEPAEEYAEMIEGFTDWHIHDYEKAVDYFVGLIKQGHNLMLTGPMFSGKNTLTTLIYNRLVAKKFVVIDGIAEVLNEDVVKSRSLARRGYPNAVRPAMRVDGNFAEIAAKVIERKRVNEEQLVTEKGDPNAKQPMVFMLDEASFVNKDNLADFIDLLNTAGIQVIISGIDKDYRGNDLPAFADPRILMKTIKRLLKSFVPFHSENSRPEGEETIRYMRIGDYKDEPLYIRDLGANLTAISRDNERAYIYTPGLAKHSLRFLLRGYDDLIRRLGINEWDIYDENLDPGYREYVEWISGQRQMLQRYLYERFGEGRFPPTAGENGRN